MICLFVTKNVWLMGGRFQKVKLVYKTGKSDCNRPFENVYAILFNMKYVLLMKCLFREYRR